MKNWDWPVILCVICLIVITYCALWDIRRTIKNLPVVVKEVTEVEKPKPKLKVIKGGKK